MAKGLSATQCKATQCNATRCKATIVALTLGALSLTGCSTGSVSASGEQGVEAISQVQHSTVSDIPGSPLKRVTLSASAQTRLGIETAVVQNAPQAVKGKPVLKVIPYSAVLYDVDGKSWVFTSSPGGSYQRAGVTIQDINGPNAFLSSGPALGTVVVAVGAAELYGAELGVGK